MVDAIANRKSEELAVGNTPYGEVVDWTVVVVVTSLAWVSALWAVGALLTGHYVPMALAMLVMFGGIVPATCEDLGWFLVNTCKLYNGGRAFLQVSNAVAKLHSWQRGRAHSMSSMRLAQTSLLQNDLDSALKYSDEALQMSENDAWYGEFYAVSVAAQVRFIAGDLNTSRRCLRRTLNIYKENIDHCPLKPLRQKVERFHIVNLLLLGRLALTEADIEGAQKFFEESYQLRMKLADRKPLAEAFKLHCEALIAFEEFQIEKANDKFFSALKALPDSVSDDCDEQTLAVEICNDVLTHLRGVEDAALLACDKLGMLNARGLPWRLVDLAARAVPPLAARAHHEAETEEVEVAV